MTDKYTNLDVAESIFFEKELEAVKAKSYDVQYPALKARSIFPLDSITDSGASTVTYQSYDHIGMAKLCANYAMDLPNVEISAKETTRKVYGGAVSFSYSIQDIRAAAMAGKPLEARKAEAARRQLLQLENKLAFDGDSSTDIPSFITNANFNQITPVDGAAGTTTWSTKTADEILADVQQMASTIRSVSKGVEMPDTLLLPESQYALIASTPRGSSSDTTILEFLLASNPWVQEVIPVYNLAGKAPVSAAYDSEDVAILFNKSPEKLWLETPQDVELFSPQSKGLSFEVPGHIRTAGVIVAYPKSVATYYGI